LTFEIEGKNQKGELFVGKLVQRDDGRWICHWSLSVVHPELGQQFGDDPLDALYQCLRFVEELIKGCEEDGLKVHWRFQGDHCGFNYGDFRS
jgi:hypothetical protein